MNAHFHQVSNPVYHAAIGALKNELKTRHKQNETIYTLLILSSRIKHLDFMKLIKQEILQSRKSLPHF